MSALSNTLSFVKVPYDMPGQIYRCELPRKEQSQELGKALEDRKITTVFLLATDAEIAASTVPNLKELYEESGCSVVHCPILDGKTIPLENMKELIQKVISCAMDGQSVLIHCKAGRARTGMVLSCLAMETLKLNATSAQRFVSAFLGDSQNSLVQKQFLSKYQPGLAAQAAPVASESSALASEKK